jgi:hypothetical protein
MRLLTLLPVALAACLALGSPVPSSAYSYAFGNGHDDDGDLGWAIVSDGNTQSSDLSDQAILDDLKDHYGDDFLYVRDGKSQYVIRDPRLVERARASSSEIGKYGREIGKLARAQAALALDNLGMPGQRRTLERTMRDLDREIARSERRGEPTAGLERARDRIQKEIDSLPDEGRSARMSPAERENLTRQSEEAQRHLHDAVQKLRRDIRDILREAKERGKAEKLDDKDGTPF